MFIFKIFYQENACYISQSRQLIFLIQYFATYSATHYNCFSCFNAFCWFSIHFVLWFFKDLRVMIQPVMYFRWNYFWSHSHSSLKGSSLKNYIIKLYVFTIEIDLKVMFLKKYLIEHERYEFSFKIINYFSQEIAVHDYELM